MKRYTLLQEDEYESSDDGRMYYTRVDRGDYDSIEEAFLEIPRFWRDPVEHLTWGEYRRRKAEDPWGHLTATTTPISAWRSTPEPEDDATYRAARPGYHYIGDYFIIDNDTAEEMVVVIDPEAGALSTGPRRAVRIA